MAYASQSAIELAAGGAARLVELADQDGDGTADAAVIARAQAAADSFIDPFLRVRFDTPIANPSESLIRLAADEAVYQMRRWRTMVSQQDLEDRKERERECKDYQTGARRPDEPLPAKSTAIRSGIVAIDSDASPVSRDGTKGMW